MPQIECANLPAHEPAREEPGHQTFRPPRGHICLAHGVYVLQGFISRGIGIGNGATNVKDLTQIVKQFRACPCDDIALRLVASQNIQLRLQVPHILALGELASGSISSDLQCFCHATSMAACSFASSGSASLGSSPRPSVNDQLSRLGTQVCKS